MLTFESFQRSFSQAGAFGYFCDIHAQMTGKIKVPVKVNPRNGDLDTNFTVRVANAGAPSGFRYVIQRRKNSGPWNAWRTTTSATQTFDPGSTGTWSFRSKLERISDGASSGFSPARSVNVSN